VRLTVNGCTRTLTVEPRDNPLAALSVLALLHSHPAPRNVQVARSGGQPVPLRHVSEDPQGDQARGATREKSMSVATVRHHHGSRSTAAKSSQSSSCPAFTPDGSGTDAALETVGRRLPARAATEEIDTKKYPRYSMASSRARRGS